MTRRPHLPALSLPFPFLLRRSTPPRDPRRASPLGPHDEASTPALNWPRRPSPRPLPYPAATQTLARHSRTAPPRRASAPTRPRYSTPPLPRRSRTAAPSRLLEHHRGHCPRSEALHRPFPRGPDRPRRRRCQRSPSATPPANSRLGEQHIISCNLLRLVLWSVNPRSNPITARR
jgi:hypothetical protein